MDIVFWIIVIVLIVGVVWWLLNRSSSANKSSAVSSRTDGGLSGGSAAASAEAAGTAGLPSAAGFGAPAEPTPPTTADDDLERPGAAGHEPAVAAESVDAPESVGERNAVEGQEAGAEHEYRAAHEPTAGAGPSRTGETVAREGAPGDQGPTGRQAGDEWETQWSETGGSAHSAGPGLAGGTAAGSAGASPAAASAAATPQAEPAQAPESAPEATEGAHYVHHTEYTDLHAPTLPGAETAAADDLTGELPDGSGGHDAPTGERESARTDDGPTAQAASSATYEPASEPIGHLAAEQPYGAGSASPAPDGSGPADYVVKGDAGAMVYYEEGHPDYEQTPAEVWFESAAHAEAAGFRPPRRTRL